MDWWLIIGLIILFLGFSVFFGAPYVPSHRRDVKKLFDEAVHLKPDDLVVDFGSGDGLVLREVARRGARAVGLEIHPVLAIISWFAARKFGGLVKTRLTNAWRASFPQATTIVYAFSVDKDGPKLFKKVSAEAARLEKALKLVCYGNPLPSIKATRQCGAYYLYTVKP